MINIAINVRSTDGGYTIISGIVINDKSMKNGMQEIRSNIFQCLLDSSKSFGILNLETITNNTPQKQSLTAKNTKDSIPNLLLRSINVSHKQFMAKGAVDTAKPMVSFFLKEPSQVHCITNKKTRKVGGMLAMSPMYITIEFIKKQVTYNATFLMILRFISKNRPKMQYMIKEQAREYI